MHMFKKIILPIFMFFSFSVIANEHLITFVCTGNTGRSPMAEALAKDYVNKSKLNIVIQSRGVNVDPKESTPEEGTLIVLKERGIDISSHRAKQLTSDDISKSEYILTMTQSHKSKILSKFSNAKNKVFTLSEFATGNNEDIMDAYQQPIAVYRKVEKQLDTYLPLALRKVSFH